MSATSLAVELHDRYCAAGDWPHVGECVAFEGYEVAANPLLTVLAGRGCARRADVPEVQAAVVGRDQIDALLRKHTVAAFSAGDSACNCDRKWRTHPAYREHLRDAVLALLNGGAR